MESRGKSQSCFTHTLYIYLQLFWEQRTIDNPPTDAIDPVCRQL